VTALEATDALDRLNSQRVQRGLRPYIRDDMLTAGAKQAAGWRAARLMAGHSVNDFSALPKGAIATTAGCAAWPVEFEFGACGAYDGYTYAGAATAIGRDGRAYHHAFYR
jgi:hypothetical protein